MNIMLLSFHLHVCFHLSERISRPVATGLHLKTIASIVKIIVTITKTELAILMHNNNYFENTL